MLIPREKFSKFSMVAAVLMIFSLSNVSRAANASSRMAEMSSAERAKLQSFIANDVRADMKDNFLERVLGPIKRLGSHETMSPETQAVIIKGIYKSIDSSIQKVNEGLAKSGSKARVQRPSLAEIEAKVGEVLRWSSYYGVFPTAFTAGVMGRAQFGVGANMGYQANFYFDQGEFKMSTYWMGGLQGGLEAQAKVQFYVAFCFGACFGGDGEGFYVGLDGMFGLGAGAGFFIEGGIDLTDMALSSFSREKMSIKDLYSTKAIYVGFGYDAGIGAGISSNLLYYDLDVQKTLVPRGKMISEDDIARISVH